jgi:D-arabinose 1-dehydrogenase-like Zn-dependent alcohol dehydrogenase
MPLLQKKCLNIVAPQLPLTSVDVDIAGTNNRSPRCRAWSCLSVTPTASSSFFTRLTAGGTIINFGSLESNIGTNIYSLVPNHLALKSVSIMSWFRLAEGEKRKDFELALGLAKSHPELFEVAHEYEFGDFQNAIQHVSRSGKTGIVLLKNQS